MIEVTTGYKSGAMLTALDTIVQQVYGSGWYATASGPSGTRVILNDGESDVAANSIIQQFDSLLVTSDKVQITADDVDTATITVDTPDGSMDWLLVADDDALNVAGQGSKAAAAGQVSVTFATDIPGTYYIWLYRTQGNYACGHVTIEAV